MPPLQRFLDPDVLAAISGLELIAKTVVDGFVAGLHRSPDFGFSQEFAEYRAYTPGDDLRHVDWNVFARTERAYLKRYRGETNSLLTVLLDASQSMEYTSHAVSKMDYARYIAASLFYLAIHSQRDAAGLIVFDDEVRNYIRPSTRQGQLARLMNGLELAEPHARTDFSKPMSHFQEFLRRRGLVVIVSDFYESPKRRAHHQLLRFHGNRSCFPCSIRRDRRSFATRGAVDLNQSADGGHPHYAQRSIAEDERAHADRTRSVEPASTISCADGSSLTPPCASI